MAREETIAKIEALLKDEKRLRQLSDNTFTEIDKDHNGAIEIAEIEDFVDYLIEDVKLPITIDEDLVSNILEAFDKDKNGTISKEELYPAIKALLVEWLQYLKEIDED